MGRIYLILNLHNRKGYIGQTTDELRVRWKAHLFKARQFLYHVETEPERLVAQGIRTSVLYKAMNKHGLENFIIIEIEQCPDEYLNQRETHFIKLYNSLAEGGHGYNLLSGGGANGKHAEQTKKKIQATKLAQIDKLRSPMLAGMPPHTSYSKKDQVFTICTQAGFGYSKAFSVKKYGSVDAAKAALIAHFNTAKALKDAQPHVIAVAPAQEVVAEEPLEPEWKAGYNVDTVYDGMISLIETLATVENIPDCSEVADEIRETIQIAIRMLNDARDTYERLIGQPMFDHALKPFTRIEEAIAVNMNPTAEEEQQFDAQGQAVAAKIKEKRRRNKFEGYINDPNRPNLWQTPDGFRIRGVVGGKKREKYYENPRKSNDEKRRAAEAQWDAFNAEEPKQE